MSILRMEGKKILYIILSSIVFKSVNTTKQTIEELGTKRRMGI